MDGTGAATIKYLVTVQATEDASFDLAVDRAVQDSVSLVPLLQCVVDVKGGQSLNGKGQTSTETLQKAGVHLKALARRLVPAMADEAVLAGDADAAERTEV